jgi:carbamate kinase
MRTAVVAVGGNALSRHDQAGTYQEQQANALRMAKVVRRLLDTGYRVIITHGNGPQVGNLAIQQELGTGVVPGQPLFVLGAMTQGQIGHILSLALAQAIGDDLRVVALVTHVLVDAQDPAFQSPSKPIGPFLNRAGTSLLASEMGWRVQDDAGRGPRRVVPSPEPQEILEVDAIRALAEQGFVVIASGGGGIPVVRRRGKLAGIDAVIDKDLSAERLASGVGAALLVLVPEVDRVILNFGTPSARPIAEMTVAEAGRYLEEGQFAPGSMGPKITAAVRFLRSGGEVAIITSPRQAADALDGTNGTRLISQSRPTAGSAVGR